MFDFNNLITYSFWSLTKTDICLFDVTPREPRGMEMGPRAYSAWMGVRRMCGMYKFTTSPSFGWDVNKTEVPCWEIATLFTR